jgi:hypothetical protein
MNLIEKVVPHLIFVAALAPTVLLLVAAAVSLSRPEPALAAPLSIQAAAACEACQGPPPAR